MNSNIQKLSTLVDAFLGGQLEPIVFEKRFSEIFDFEEIDYRGNSEGYFLGIRNILEHLTFSKNDLKNHPDYFVDGKQLKDKIFRLKTEYKLPHD